MEILIRAAQNKQRGCMRPAGRQFDVPDIKGEGCFFFIKSRLLLY